MNFSLHIARILGSYDLLLLGNVLMEEAGNIKKIVI